MRGVKIPTRKPDVLGTRGKGRARLFVPPDKPFEAPFVSPFIPQGKQGEQGELFLALYDPFAVRVAEQHVLGQLECEIWVETFGGSITPPLMAYAAGIHVEALLLPPLVPGTLSSLSHTSVFGRFNNFEDKLRPHGRLSHEMDSRFDIAGCLGG